VRFIQRWLVVVVSLIAGCNQVVYVLPPTEILLRIHCDQVDLCAATKELRITLSVLNATWKAREPVSIVRETFRWPVEIPITPSKLEYSARTFEVVVEALDVEKKVLVQSRAITNFVVNAWRVLNVPISVCEGHAVEEGFLCNTDSACHGDSCSTCVEGSCQPVTVTPSDRLPAWEAPLEECVRQDACGYGRCVYTDDDYACVCASGPPDPGGKGCSVDEPPPSSDI
jgi:hypothetical protein